jgi:hypothetical protein
VRPEQGLVAQLLTWFPLANFLRNWDYRPVTRWFEHFITINWNAGDADIERHVLGEVGSYGRQLSHVLDAVDLLVGQLDLTSLTPDEQKVVVRLQDLASAARSAVNGYRGRVQIASPSPQPATRDSLPHGIGRSPLQDL